jgi:hypothetical protein
MEKIGVLRIVAGTGGIQLEGEGKWINPANDDVKKNLEKYRELKGKNVKVILENGKYIDIIETNEKSNIISNSAKSTRAVGKKQTNDGKEKLKKIIDKISASEINEQNFMEIIKEFDMPTFKKNGLDYIAWSDIILIANLIDKNMNFEIIPRIDDNGNITPLHKVGENSGGVWIECTMFSKKRKIFYPVIDYKNKSIPYDKITSFDVNSAIMRGIVKCFAMFNLGINIYGSSLDLE